MMEYYVGLTPVDARQLAGNVCFTQSLFAEHHCLIDDLFTIYVSGKNFLWPWTFHDY